MKKIWTILVVIVVLIAVWLGAAWYTGTRIEAQANHAIARINATWAKTQQVMGAQIKPISYERGLLSSRARLAITSPLLGNQPLAEYDVTFQHGPFPLTLQGGLAPRQYQAHAELLATSGPFKMVTGALMNGKPPLIMDIGCSYSNHCTGTGSVPPIDADLGPFSKNAKLTFGGMQMQFDSARQSDKDYKFNGDMQLLPLSIGGQDFGSGQITITSDAQSANEIISWKNDQGESKLTIALIANQPMPFWSDDSITPESLPKLIKTVSANLALSKPMVVDLAARALNLTKGADLAAARQEISAKFDATLANTPDAGKYIRNQGDLLTSDWQYADGKLIVNGQESPELLEQIKQGYLTQMRLRDQMLRARAGNTQAPDDGVPPASAPQQAASGQ